MTIAQTGTLFDSTASPSASSGYAGTFIPEVWSGKLIEKFYLSTVFGAIANTDYEGEISSYGDKVNIRQRADVTIRDYTPEADLVVERPAASNKELLIDQGKYFNAVLDDVYKVQSDINLMNEWATDAAEQMKIVIDSDILQYMVGKTGADNAGATAGAISGGFNLGTIGSGLVVNDTNILDLIVDMGTVLDEANRPESGRWLVLPAWACGMIKKSDLQDASIAGDGTSILRNGRIGMIDRFTIYMSNQLPNNDNMSGTMTTAGEHAVFAGITNAVSFASQMTNTEQLRSERTFGSLMRGLQVYGRSVTDPDSYVQAIIT